MSLLVGVHGGNHRCSSYRSQGIWSGTLRCMWKLQKEVEPGWCLFFHIVCHLIKERLIYMVYFPTGI